MAKVTLVSKLQERLREIGTEASVDQVIAQLAAAKITGGELLTYLDAIVATGSVDDQAIAGLDGVTAAKITVGLKQMNLLF